MIESNPLDHSAGVSCFEGNHVASLPINSWKESKHFKGMAMKEQCNKEVSKPHKPSLCTLPRLFQAQHLGRPRGIGLFCTSDTSPACPVPLQLPEPHLCQPRLHCRAKSLSILCQSGLACSIQVTSTFFSFFTFLGFFS